VCALTQCKQQLAETHGTHTGTFANGAYLTDPIRFVSLVCGQSPFIAVGGDAGGGHTKLGVTYSTKGVQYFAALLVYEGSDSYDQLNALTSPGYTPFTGDSTAFPHIFTVLQHIIDRPTVTRTARSFLNGDWPFINTLLGLKNASAIHPCPICIISSSSLMRTARYRTPTDRHSNHPDQPALLRIPPEQIVPTPLHLFLGISNRIIFDVFTELLGESCVLDSVSRVKTTHSAGCGGVSDVHQLNGPELARWIKGQDSSASVLSSAVVAAAAASSTAIAAATTATASILTRWLKQLHDSLLHTREWTREDIDAWRCVVNDIHQHWRQETSSHAFPKLHMLHHTIDFAERHRFLGRASEAQSHSTPSSINSFTSNIVTSQATQVSDYAVRYPTRYCAQCRTTWHEQAKEQKRNRKNHVPLRLVPPTRCDSHSFSTQDYPTKSTLALALWPRSRESNPRPRRSATHILTAVPLTSQWRQVALFPESINGWM